MSDFIDDLEPALKTGFIDSSIKSNQSLRPDFIVNDKLANTKVLPYLLQRFEVCDEFWISAAFLTTSGVASLHNAFSVFSGKNMGKGRIFVSDYLSFTQPEALRRISRFTNIETRLLSGHNYHGKGYLFRTGDQFDCLIGSSNLTANAFCKNGELNIHITASVESSVVQKFFRIFDKNFNNSLSLSDQVLQEYEKIYENRTYQSEANPIPRDNINYDLKIMEKDQSDDSMIELVSKKEPEIDRVISNPDKLNIKHISVQSKSFEPNLIQNEAMSNLTAIRKRDENRALVVSATGTGKTVLAAFDAKLFNAKKLLYVVHRFNIAAKAMETFKKIFGASRSMGMYSGERKEIKSDFLFSTVQTINNDNHLKNFSPDEFDYIIIDETHRAGAQTYLRILEYFRPKFLLGMTATPERTDGFDIYSLFNHNVGCEIRLHRAMDEELLCPFHYFGISDISVEGQELDDLSDFNLLVSEQRIEHIIQALKEYGSDDGVARGLVFCSRIEEASQLSLEFNRRGFKTIALSGVNSDTERQTAIRQIESDNIDEKLDYIFTVDIFNEGIDIPKLNQIIMLRPTQSAIIFIQQLGRGLRKVDNKEYLTVIDFIGNYQKNYLIPVALYGDRSLNKDELRKLVSSRSSLIPGASTVNFDEVTKEKIYESINSSNLQTKKDLVQDYKLMKFRLGRAPMMLDFLNFESRDPYQYVEYSRSFYNFSALNEKESEIPQMPEDHIKLLEYLSKFVNNGIRGLESLILFYLIKNTEVTFAELRKNYYQRFGVEVHDDTIFAAFNCLNLRFHQDRFDKKFSPIGIINNYSIVKILGKNLQVGTTLKRTLSNIAFSNYLLDTTNYSLLTFESKLRGMDFQDGFIRYQKYTRVDVFRLLKWETSPEPLINIGGYKVSKNKRNCPIFVTLKKSENISETIKYEDKFLSPELFSWMTRSRRTLSSPEVIDIISQSENKIRLPLFVKKSNDEGQAHYFIGDLTVVEGSPIEERMAAGGGKEVSVVNIRFIIDKPVSEELYQYIADT